MRPRPGSPMRQRANATRVTPYAPRPHPAPIKIRLGLSRALISALTGYSMARDATGPMGRNGMRVRGERICFLVTKSYDKVV